MFFGTFGKNSSGCVKNPFFFAAGKKKSDFQTSELVTFKLFLEKKKQKKWAKKKNNKSNMIFF